MSVYPCFFIEDMFSIQLTFFRLQRNFPLEFNIVLFWNTFFYSI